MKNPWDARITEELVMMEAGSAALGTWYLQEGAHTGCGKEGKVLSIAWSRHSRCFSFFGMSWRNLGVQLKAEGAPCWPAASQGKDL